MSGPRVADADDKRTLQQKVEDGVEEHVVDLVNNEFDLVWRKITGEETLDQAMQQFDAAVDGIKMVRDRVLKAVKGKF